MSEGLRYSDNQDPSTYRTFDEVRDHAPHGHEDMVGLQWVENDLTYRVSRHDTLTRTRRVPKKGLRAAPPRLLLRKHIEGGLGFIRHTDPLKDYENEQEAVDYRSVDVLNKDGDLVDILTFTGSYAREIERRRIFEGIHQRRVERLLGMPQEEPVDRFEDFFKVHSRENPNAPGEKVARRLENHDWEGPKPKPEVTDFDEHNSLTVDKNIFQAITQEQLRLGLEGWEGLTWNSKTSHKYLADNDRVDTHRSFVERQVLRDEVLIRKNPITGISYPDRVFEVRTRDERGNTIGYHVYTISELHEAWLGEKRDLPKTSTKGILPEKVSFRTPKGWSPETGHQSEDNPIRREKVEELLDNITFRQPKDQERVQACKADIGSERFREAALGLSESYLTDLARLGLIGNGDDQVPDKEAVAHVILGLANKYGSDGAGIFEAGEEGRKLRSRFLSEQIGFVFGDKALTDTPHPKREWKDDRPVEKIIHMKSENTDVTNRLQTMLYRQLAEKILKPNKDRPRNSEDDNLELDLHERFLLGHALRLSMGRRVDVSNEESWLAKDLEKELDSDKKKYVPFPG